MPTPDQELQALLQQHRREQQRVASTQEKTLPLLSAEMLTSASGCRELQAMQQIHYAAAPTTPVDPSRADALAYLLSNDSPTRTEAVMPQQRMAQAPPPQGIEVEFSTDFDEDFNIDVRPAPYMSRAASARPEPQPIVDIDALAENLFMNREALEAQSALGAMAPVDDYDTPPRRYTSGSGSGGIVVSSRQIDGTWSYSPPPPPPPRPAPQPAREVTPRTSAAAYRALVATQRTEAPARPQAASSVPVVRTTVYDRILRDDII